MQEARKNSVSRIGRYVAYIGLAGIAILYGLAKIVDDLASAIRALPAMINISTNGLQIFSLIFGPLAALANMVVLTVALPRSLKTLARLNPLGHFSAYFKWKLGLYRLGYLWHRLKYSVGASEKPVFESYRKNAQAAYPNRQQKGVMIAFIFALFTGCAFGFFTASSTQTIILGLAALFGISVSTGGIGIAIAIALIAGAQALSMFLILAAECGDIVTDFINKNGRFNWARVREFLMIGEFAPTNRYEHCKRVFKIFFTLTGGALILGAAVFVLMGQGESVRELFSDKLPQWVIIATQATVVYFMAGMTQLSLSLKSAASIMGGIGKSVGGWIGKHLVNAKLRAEIELHERTEKLQAKAHEKPWAKQTMPERIQTVFNKTPLYLLTWALFMLTFGGTFFEGMRGDGPLHGKLDNNPHAGHHSASTEMRNFHQINSALEADPSLFKDVSHIQPAPIEWQAVTAGLATGVDQGLTDAFLLHEREEDDDENHEHQQLRAAAPLPAEKTVVFPATHRMSNHRLFTPVDPSQTTPIQHAKYKNFRQAPELPSAVECTQTTSPA